MKTLAIAVFTATFMVANLSSGASAATDASGLAFTPLSAMEAPAARSDEGKAIRVADGFGAGLAIGFIGGLITGKIKDRHYGYHRRSYRHRGCRYWSRRCGHNWGYHNRNYYGCMRYHGCR